MQIKILIGFLMIVFLLGCSTETIEVGPEEIENILNETEELPETTPAPVVAPTVNTTTTTTEATPAIITHTVEVAENKFTPNTLTIKVGETVTWKNVKATGKLGSQTSILGVRGVCGGKKLVSDDFAPGEEFSYTFDEAGECPYIDIYYTNNAGKIIIE